MYITHGLDNTEASCQILEKYIFFKYLLLIAREDDQFAAPLAYKNFQKLL